MLHEQSSKQQRGQLARTCTCYINLSSAAHPLGRVVVVSEAVNPFVAQMRGKRLLYSITTQVCSTLRHLRDAQTDRSFGFGTKRC